MQHHICESHEEAPIKVHPGVWFDSDESDNGSYMWFSLTCHVLCGLVRKEANAVEKERNLQLNTLNMSLVSLRELQMVFPLRNRDLGVDSQK